MKRNSLVAYARLFNHSLERGPALSSFSFILEAEAKRDWAHGENLHSYLVQFLLYTL